MKQVMDPYRKNKLNQSILEVISRMIQVSVKDPRVGFVTINSVEVNRDGSVAHVYWSVLGDEDDRKTSFAGLKKARGYMMSNLTRTLGLRQAPELRFVYDDTVAKGLELDSVLDDLAQKGEFKSEADKKREMDLDDLHPPLELVNGIRKADKIWVVPHFNPDPDAMGSALALAEALHQMGRDVTVVSYPDPPLGLDDMPGFDRFVRSEDAEQIYEQEQPDTLILVDCHHIDRCGPLEETLDRFETRWCVDHHLISGRRAPESGWIEARSCSTCTLIYRLIDVLGSGDDDFTDEAFDLSVDMATNIYAGLINDTGGFRFSNTLPFSFELARRLSEMGVDTAEVSRQTMHRYRREGVALMQLVLGSFEYHSDGQVLILRATQAMLEETGGNLSDTEGFVNIATAVDGVKYIAFMKELEDQVWRVSLRVRGEGDVQTLAAQYGGGGHKQAAGCTINGDGDEIASQLAIELGMILRR
jgi:bifunctional oligoribonuclease and PAP phosphatase NrnA